MDQLVEFHEAGARVVVYRDVDDLVFWSDFDDNGRSIVTQSRLPVADYVAKGEGRWPWYDLGQQRAGALAVLEACGATPLWYAVRSLDDTAALLCWWVANVRWAAYRAREVVDVIELLLLGGAVVTERQRERPPRQEFRASSPRSMPRLESVRTEGPT